MECVLKSYLTCNTYIECLRACSDGNTRTCIESPLCEQGLKKISEQMSVNTV